MICPIKNKGYMKMVVLVVLVACHASNGIFQKIGGMKPNMGRAAHFASKGKIPCHHATMPAIFSNPRF
ncbi:MAG: hypothetical protein HC875_29470 [Anaerolineales bacterium]|nr:hypothetical protein [Anaerolineales bacterium]